MLKSRKKSRYVKKNRLKISKKKKKEKKKEVNSGKTKTFLYIQY
jgi:hypothetical protein